MEIRRKCFWLGGLVQLLVLVLSYQQSASARPDGINLYKDWIRNKNDDEDYATKLDEEDFTEPKLSFYRTPVSSFYEYNSDYPFEKRTFNKYKNMMINKDAPEVLLTEEREEPSKGAVRFGIPRITLKRSPGAILSWAIPAANRVRVIPNSYRPPAINRPAA
ncbi:uncharacterized protein LOC109400486 [Aedes albopictus]|uniref:Secreted protein n=1 Tax=Aedes albopictus TaxID=7160 RepID=A0ABM1Z5Q0_AEDAL|nr:uncharacterized protein LOC109408291 [Aedes albopictus]KXJ82202.1 hypothetical protein RP20_CCG015089 [Aedes albopictus]